MNLKRIVIGVIILTTLATCWFLYKDSLKMKHVFINETSDHRFDESIRVSIIAAYKRTGVQNAVVISDAPFNPNSNDASKIFKELKLGRRTSGRAILYYFSPAKKTLKIEVGYALEGALPDITVRGLELAAKSFIFTDRYQDFWAEIINTMNIEIQNIEHGKLNNSSVFDFNNYQFLSGGAGLTSHTYAADWSQFEKESIQVSSEIKNRFKASKEKSETIEAYLKSLQDGIGDADLDVLTKESRFFRRETPRSSYQQFRNARMYKRAIIEKAMTVGNLAFYFFASGEPVLPIVLRLEENDVWRVHEPYSLGLFQRFEDSNKVFVKYNFSGMPVSFSNYVTKRFGKELYSLNDGISLNFLMTKPSPASYESSLIQLYWIDQAEKNLENKKFEDMSEDDLKFAVDIYGNLGKFSKFVSAYKRMSELAPEKKELAVNYKYYKEHFDFRNQDWVTAR